MESILNDATAVLADGLYAELLHYIESGDLELPLLPSVVWRVMEMSTNDDVDARQLSELIHSDQALAGHLLRIVNSPAYMPRMPIVSLQQAVSRLGTRILGEIAFSVSLQSRVFDVKGYEDELRSLWQHAVGTAAYAKEVARLRRRNVEGAFLCGLLHDIGKPVILQAIVDLQKARPWSMEATAVSAVMEAYHTHVGSLIAKAWALPPHVSESIAYHHDYLVAPTCTESVMITRLADSLSYHLMMPEIFDEQSVRHHPVLADLNFYPDDVETLLAKHDAIQQIVEAMS